MTAPLTIFVPHASDCLTDHLPHGDGLVAFEFVRRLAERGHTVHVASPEINVSGTLPAGLHLHETATGGAGPRLHYMLAVRRLYARVSEGCRVDIVHQLNPVFTGISLAFAGARAPIVLGSFLAEWPSGEVIRSTRSRLVTGLKRGVASLQQRQARALLVSTPGAADRIVDRSANRRKIVHLPHGIDPALYRPSFGPAATQPAIVFLGGLERRKGIYTLLDAFPRVRAAIPAARLIVGGAGHENLRVAQRIAALPEPDAVTLLGLVPRSDVPRVLASATVFALPSIGEPFGMSLLEAMASGKPVVVTDAGGPHYIVDSDGGRKVPPDDPVALADALIEILASPALQRRMGAHNRALIETVYSWDRVIDRLEELYYSVIESRGRTA
jgi:glycosyltransferase involved in cell wall biosynthesis